mmetsp:Transcript_12161/g.32100  ORF Transcript_12161/g.32100 Transcript_12161/m.32100 type:complete len:232 (+) Transcript_12161:63-758(+)
MLKSTLLASNTRCCLEMASGALDLFSERSASKATSGLFPVGISDVSQGNAAWSSGVAFASRPDQVLDSTFSGRARRSLDDIQACGSSLGASYFDALRPRSATDCESFSPSTFLAASLIAAGAVSCSRRACFSKARWASRFFRSCNSSEAWRMPLAASSCTDESSSLAAAARLRDACWASARSLSSTSDAARLSFWVDLSDSSVSCLLRGVFGGCFTRTNSAITFVSLSPSA